MDILVTALLVAVVCALCWDCWIGRNEKGSSKERWILAATILGAAALRFIYLEQSALEHLEASYLFEAVKPESLFGVLTSRQAAEQMHQPLFPVMLRGWAALFGRSEFALRFLPAVFSLACVPLAWSLVRDQTQSARAALWAAALTAAAPLMVWYGRDCSPYALLGLMATVAACSASQALDSDSQRPAIRAALALTLAFYAHFHGAWVAISVGGWLLLHHRKAFWRTTAVTALLCLPWIGVMLTKLFTSVAGLHEDQPIMRYSHAWPEAAGEGGRMLLGTPAALLWVGAALLAAGLFFLWRKHRRLASLLLVSLGVAVVAEAHILWQLSAVKGIVYIDVRHYLYLTPLIAAAIAAIPYSAIAAGYLAIQLSVSAPMVSGLEKPDVRSAAQYIKKYAKPNHGVALLPAPWYQPILEHYLLGECPGLVHGRSHDAWWSYGSCKQSETPQEGSIYGFPGTPERIYQSTRRKNLEYLWVVDIRDHRFGLAVPPTDPQERFLCWEARKKALMAETRFGKWVVVSLYDMRRLEMLSPPPKAEKLLPKTVTSDEAWQLNCARFDSR
jgi:hypothetical protein